MAAPYRNILEFQDDLLKLIGPKGLKNTARMRALGEAAIILIVRRTRLGKTYTRERVRVALDKIRDRPKRLAALSPNYVKFRKKNRRLLSRFTNPTRSGLTFTGEMLDSMRVKRASKGSVVIGPRGRRNENLARWHEAGAGRLPARPFNNLSVLEARQLQRFYRKMFGDLQKRTIR